MPFRVELALALTMSTATGACVVFDPPYGRGAMTQDEVEQLAGIEVLDALFLGGTVTDLSPLLSLRTIEGDLSIVSTTALTSLHGLENVNAADGDGTYRRLSVLIAENAALTDLKALRMPRLGLLELAGDNAALIDATLESLEDVDTLVIKDEAALRRFSAPALRAINEELKVETSPRLCDVELPALRELGRLEFLEAEETCWPQEERDALRALSGQTE